MPVQQARQFRGRGDRLADRVRHHMARLYTEIVNRPYREDGFPSVTLAPVDITRPAPDADRDGRRTERDGACATVRSPHSWCSARSTG
ncbi:hypothetical protein GCM10010182_25390 [Actinomadura cremea]|nr:hypothetical protein GCM10010182_25390 [Actinomadura cremea]